MVKWYLLSDKEAREIWDHNLTGFADYTLYQSYAWGEYKRAFGWIPCRWAAYNDQGDIMALFQGLLRRYPLGIGLVWGAGGPVGDAAAWNPEMQMTFMETLGLKRVYCRFRSHRQYCVGDALLLKSRGWNRSIHSLNSGWSMLMDFAGGKDRLFAGLSKNWRHNLRRFEKNNLSVRQWINPDIDEMQSVYDSMQDYKKLEVQYSHRQLEVILEKLGQNIVVFRCDDQNGNLVGLRGCAIIGDRGWDLFAATTVDGRKTYASYGLFWALIEHCGAVGVKYYDLSGIDPLSNRGVYDFKRGTGAEPLEYLGEWDWAAYEWLRWLGNLAILKKGGQM